MVLVRLFLIFLCSPSDTPAGWHCVPSSAHQSNISSHLLTFLFLAGKYFHYIAFLIMIILQRINKGNQHSIGRKETIPSNQTHIIVIWCYHVPLVRYSPMMAYVGSSTLLLSCMMKTIIRNREEKCYYNCQKNFLTWLDGILILSSKK